MKTNIFVGIVLLSFALMGIGTHASAPDCSSALVHKHDRLKDVEIDISSWAACTVTGKINGVAVTLFNGDPTCPLRAKVPGRLRARIDETCGAIVILTDGPVIPEPMPTPCQTPTPTPSPTPTPTTRNVHGFVFDKQPGGSRVVGAMVRLMQGPLELDRMPTNAQGTFTFTGVPIGSLLVVTHPGLVFAPITVDSATGNFFAYGGPGPTPSPTPGPTPAPSPSPETDPSPTPSPTPAPQHETLDLEWPETEAAKSAVWRDVVVAGRWQDCVTTATRIRCRRMKP